MILPAPYWTTYPEAITLAGGVPVVVTTGPDADYLPSVEQLEAARTPRTKVLLWCSPSNPTGSVASRELTEAVGRWAVEHGVWVITDEIYEHLVYDGAEAVSMPVAVPELAETCVVLNGVAKTYAMTGWRVGWMAGPADVIKAATNLQSHLSSQRLQRRPARRAGGRLRAAGRRRGDARGVRPAPAHDRRAALGDPGCPVPDAARRVLRLPRRRRS